MLLALPALLAASEWTVLVYMVADNSLAAWADSDLVEMKAVGSNDDIVVIAQVDKPGIGCRRYYVASDTLYQIADLGVVDMCDPATLGDFIVWADLAFPSRRTCLVLWDHGTAWTTVKRKSFGSDWSSGGEMDIVELYSALENARQQTGVRIHLLAFDACLMQHVEIAYELRDEALAVLGSEAGWPLTGFPYDDLLAHLISDPSMNETTLAAALILACRHAYEPGVPASLGAVRTAGLESFAASFQSVNHDLVASNARDRVALARREVQTFPVFGCSPATSDDYIDLGDYVTRLASGSNGSDLAALVAGYDDLIIAGATWGDSFPAATGLALWFPDRYLDFKSLLDGYLGLAWKENDWPSFLNWYYAADDIRPTPVTISASAPGRDNDFTLNWTPSFDLARIAYDVVKASDSMPVFVNPCEDTSAWHVRGFTLSADDPAQGVYSFFSGNASNLACTLSTRDTLAIDGLAMIDVALRHNTEEGVDSLVIQHGSFRDTFYGNSRGWFRRRTIIPSGADRLSFIYHTNGAVNNGGGYVDDVRVYALANGRYVREDLVDQTTLKVFNETSGIHLYGVMPGDEHGNQGDVSGFVAVTLEDFAVPFSVPNPFQNDCTLVLDFPDSRSPEVIVYSIAGRTVRRFGPDEIQDQRVYWNGLDRTGRHVGAGLYFVVVRDGDFTRLGKIACQR